MNRGNLIRRIHMECPICDKVHEIEERTRITELIIKGEEVNYVETYYLCPNSDEDENEFVTGKMMNDNLLNARNESYLVNEHHIKYICIILHNMIY